MESGRGCVSLELHKALLTVNDDKRNFSFAWLLQTVEKEQLEKKKTTKHLFDEVWRVFEHRTTLAIASKYLSSSSCEFHKYILKRYTRFEDICLYVNYLSNKQL